MSKLITRNFGVELIGLNLNYRKKRKVLPRAKFIDLIEKKLLLYRSEIVDLYQTEIINL